MCVGNDCPNRLCQLSMARVHKSTRWKETSYITVDRVAQQTHRPDCASTELYSQAIELYVLHSEAKWDIAWSYQLHPAEEGTARCYEGSLSVSMKSNLMRD